MALALLPARDIPVAYYWLQMSIPADIVAILMPFLNYFYNELIMVTPPQLWSVFNLIHRTDNLLEAYHRKLKIRFGIHPSIWKFTGKKL